MQPTNFLSVPYELLSDYIIFPQKLVSDCSDHMSEGSVTGSSFLSDGSQKMHYEAESPDELALVKAANTYGCKLLKRSPGKVKVLLPGKGHV